MDIKKLTVGIEEEYQVINPDTGELTSYIAEFIERDAILFKDSMVPEFLKSQLEVTSKVCKNIKQARKEVIRLRKFASKYAQKNNCTIIAAGTHPYSRWEDQVRTDKERYRGLYGHFTGLFGLRNRGLLERPHKSKSTILNTFCPGSTSDMLGPGVRNKLYDTLS